MLEKHITHGVPPHINKLLHLDLQATKRVILIDKPLGLTDGRIDVYESVAKPRALRPGHKDNLNIGACYVVPYPLDEARIELLDELFAPHTLLRRVVSECACIYGFSIEHAANRLSREYLWHCRFGVRGLDIVLTGNRHTEAHIVIPERFELLFLVFAPIHCIVVVDRW